jgi:hypothetical protein
LGACRVRSTGAALVDTEVIPFVVEAAVGMCFFLLFFLFLLSRSFKVVQEKVAEGKAILRVK